MNLKSRLRLFFFNAKAPFSVFSCVMLLFLVWTGAFFLEDRSSSIRQEDYQRLIESGQVLEGTVVSCDYTEFIVHPREGDVYGPSVSRHVGVTIEYAMPGTPGKQTLLENWDYRWKDRVHKGDKVQLYYLPGNRFLKIASTHDSIRSDEK